MLSSVEVFDPLFGGGVGRWESAPDMTRARGGCDFYLLVVNNELYAVGGDENATEVRSIEKMDRLTRVWQVITELNVDRTGSAVVSMGSKIVLLGGGDEGSEERSTWDAFDVISRQWASSTLSAATRRLPRNYFYLGCAVVVP